MSSVTSKSVYRAVATGVVTGGIVCAVSTVCGKILKSNALAYWKPGLITGSIAATITGTATGIGTALRAGKIGVEPVREFPSFKNFNIGVTSTHGPGRYVGKVDGDYVEIGDLETGMMMRVGQTLPNRRPARESFLLRDPTGGICRVTVPEDSDSELDVEGFMQEVEDLFQVSYTIRDSNGRPLQLCKLFNGVNSPLALCERTEDDDSKTLVIYRLDSSLREKIFRTLPNADFDPRRDIVHKNTLLRVRGRMLHRWNFYSNRRAQMKQSGDFAECLALRWLGHPENPQMLLVHEDGLIKLGDIRFNLGMAIDPSSSYLLHPEDANILLVAAGDGHPGNIQVYDISKGEAIAECWPVSDSIQDMTIVSSSDRGFLVRITHESGLTALRPSEIYDVKGS